MNKKDEAYHPQQNPYENTTRDTWLLFKIMSEFVDGFELLKDIGPAISIFGSARLKKDSPYGKMAFQVSKVITASGFSLISGGGPGLMEASNQGARRGIQLFKKKHPKKSPPLSVGLTIQVPSEQKSNDHLDLEVPFKYFFVRKVMFAKYACAFLILPGGFGTLDELFEALTLIQTKKIDPIPIILMGKSYWKDLLQWMKKTLLTHGAIAQKHFADLHIADDPQEVVRFIKNFSEISKK